MFNSFYAISFSASFNYEQSCLELGRTTHPPTGVVHSHSHKRGEEREGEQKKEKGVEERERGASQLTCVICA